jgi:hypothetical protein
MDLVFGKVVCLSHTVDRFLCLCVELPLRGYKYTVAHVLVLALVIRLS